MAAAFLLAAFGVSHAAAQMEHSNSVFAYMGCASLDLSRFGGPVGMQNGHVYPEACQDACHGHQFAALLPHACHCGDDATAMTIIDERSCNAACMNDVAFGKCGGLDLDHGRSIASVYDFPVSPRQERGPVSLPAPATESPCPSSEQLPSAPHPAITLATPIGSAPEAPVISSTYFSGPPAPALPGKPLSEEDWTSCSQHGHSATEVPVPHEPTHASTNGYHRTLACDTGDTAAPCATEGPHSPEYSSGGEAHETPGCGGIGNECKPSRPAELPKAPSQKTLWPVAPYPSGSTFEPRVPSQVPENDATHGRDATLSTFGGLAVIAAMIM